MFNPNSSSYERTERVLADLTPDPRDFAGRIYPAEDVKRDLAQLEAFKHNPDYKSPSGRSRAKVLEKTFTDMVELGDWFREETAYGDDPDYQALITFPTSEIDDAFNHIDLIGMIKNTATDHRIVPFAIDLTYNTSDEKMASKFAKRHNYGTTPNAPDGVSEFGTVRLVNYHGQMAPKTRRMSLKHKLGLKIPGFATAKYYEDKNNPWTPMHEKGRINVMPRFVIGYSTAISDVLAEGPPTEKYREEYGETAYQSKKASFKDAERRAKWCTLFECAEQAQDIQMMIETLTSQETVSMSQDELEEAKFQIAALNDYFGKALEIATAESKGDAEELSAIKYAKNDAVHAAIKRHSRETYIDNGRQL